MNVFIVLQTMNRREKCRSEKFALNEKTSLNKKLASRLHRRQSFLFHFLLYPARVFLCAVQIVWSYSLIVLFLLFFLIKGENMAKYWVNILSDWTLEIQNLLGTVHLYFLFVLIWFDLVSQKTKNDNNKRKKAEVKTSGFPQESS